MRHFLVDFALHAIRLADTPGFTFILSTTPPVETEGKDDKALTSMVIGSDDNTLSGMGIGSDDIRDSCWRRSCTISYYGG